MGTVSCVGTRRKVCTCAGLHARGCEFACVYHHSLSHTHTHKAPIGTPLSCAPSEHSPSKDTHLPARDCHSSSGSASRASKSSLNAQQPPCMAQMQKLRHRAMHRDPQGEHARCLRLPGSAQVGRDQITQHSPTSSPSPSRCHVPWGPG